MEAGDEEQLNIPKIQRDMAAEEKISAEAVKKARELLNLLISSF